MAILPDLSNASREQLLAHIAAMQVQAQSKLTCKVSEKGALCVYGLGRFPVTLYASQWDRLLKHSETIKAFMVQNADRLATKA